MRSAIIIGALAAILAALSQSGRRTRSAAARPSDLPSAFCLLPSGFQAPAQPGGPLWKEAADTAASYPWFADYVRVLERFPLYAQRGWHESEENGEKPGYFGGPEHDERAMSALVDTILTLAVLASESTYDPHVSGLTPETVRTEAVRGFRYALVTHVTGGGKRPDDQPWGDAPLSGAWAVRLAVAARALGPVLTPADLEALRRVLGHEADSAAKVEPRSQALGESGAPANARDAATLAWAAAIAPNDPRVAAWQTAARDRMMNALTAPRDRFEAGIVDGRPVRDQVRTENTLPEYLLEEGGAVSPDPALSTLEALALARYAYLSTDRTPPDAALQGVPETWRALDRLWMLAGRFAYPCGQMGPRQPVGPASALPSAVVAQSAGVESDLARAVERALFRSLESEQAQNRDGTFFGSRFSGGAVTGEGARFETGAYAALALALRMHRTTPRLVSPAPIGTLQRSLEGAWVSPAGELGAARSPRAFASFAWRFVSGGMGLTGLFVPPGADDMAGWPRDQLSGSFALEGFQPVRRLAHRDRLVAGGFATTGRILEGLRGGKPGLSHHLSWTALPDAGLGVLFDLTLADQDARVTQDEGLQLALANDLFNANHRTIVSDDGKLEITGVQPDAKEETRAAGSHWLNADGRIGIVLAYSQQPFTLRDFSRRDQDPLDPFHSLLHERIDCPYRTDAADYRAGQVVRDTAVVLVAGDAAATRQVAERSRVAATGQELIRAIRVVGPRGHQYLIVANFAEREQTLRLRPPGEALAPLLELRLGPLETQVIGE